MWKHQWGFQGARNKFCQLKKRLSWLLQMLINQVFKAEQTSCAHKKNMQGRTFNTVNPEPFISWFFLHSYKFAKLKDHKGLTKLCLKIAICCKMVFIFLGKLILSNSLFYTCQLCAALFKNSALYSPTNNKK